MADPLSSREVTTAIDAGVAFLARIQLASGEFQTFTGPSPDLMDTIPFTTSPYITTFVGHALSHVPASDTLVSIQQGIGRFLEAEEEPDGSWNFQGRGAWRLPADLDTTACAAAALLILGRRSPRSNYRLLLQVVRPTAAAPGGPYYTYIGTNQEPGIPIFAPYARELDVLVNINVVFLCGLLDIDVPGAVAFLVRTLQSGRFTENNRYYISWHFLAYTLARAYADGNVRALDPSIPVLLKHVRTGLAVPVVEASAFNLACHATSLMKIGRDATVAPYIEALLAAQEPDGGWPIWAAGAGFPREWDWSWLDRWPDGPASADRGWCWGSRAMTSAFALESLSMWRRLRRH